MNIKDIRRLPEIETREGNLFVKGFYGESNRSGTLLGWSAIPENAVHEGYYVMDAIVNIEEHTPKHLITLEQRAETFGVLKLKAVLAAVTAIAGIVIASAAFWLNYLPAVMIIGASMTIGTVISLIASGKIDDRRRDQWHAAEHKVVFLLQNGFPLTLEEAKRASAISGDCGVNNKHLREPRERQLQDLLEVAKKLERRVKAIQ